MGRFRIEPRQGHMDRVHRIYGYLRKHPDGRIRFRTGIPQHEKRFTEPVHEWMYSVYGTGKEQLPPDAPTPKGNPVRTSTHVDANLMHCKLTGRSVTGILNFLNQTPISWFSKRQKTVETATYGSEFVAARTATDQIVDLRYTLRSMGVPLDKASWMFGDNMSVITSSTIPHSVLNKRHNALSYHRVREAIAYGILKFVHINGTENVKDVMTKFLPHAKFWPLIKPLLF